MTAILAVFQFCKASDNIFCPIHPKKPLKRSIRHNYQEQSVSQSLIKPSLIRFMTKNTIDANAPKQSGGKVKCNDLPIFLITIQSNAKANEPISPINNPIHVSLRVYQSGSDQPKSSGWQKKYKPTKHKIKQIMSYIDNFSFKIIHARTAVMSGKMYIITIPVEQDNNLTLRNPNVNKTIPARHLIKRRNFTLLGI